MSNGKFELALSSEESHALGTAAHQRALAVRALIDIRAAVDDDRIPQLVEVIRLLGKKDAKTFQKSLGRAAQLINSSVALHAPIPGAVEDIDEVPITSNDTSAEEKELVVDQDNFLDLQEDTLKQESTVNRSWLEGATVERLDVVDDFGETMEHIRIGLRELLETTDSLDDTVGAQRQVASLDRLSEMEVIKLDDSGIENIIGMYIKSAVKASRSAVITNSICFWAYLKGVSVDDILPYRSITKPITWRADIHNARASVETGVLRYWRQASKPKIDVGAQDETKIQEMIERYGTPASLSPDVDAPIPEESISYDPILPEEPPRDAGHNTITSRPIEEEPLHVQTAEIVINLLRLDESYKAAVVSLFNPEAKGNISENMQLVISRLNDYLIAASEREDILNNIDASNSQLGRAVFRSLVGHYRDATGRSVRRPAVRLAEQFKKDSPLEKQRKITAFFNFLPHVWGALDTSLGLDEAESQRVERPIYRVGANGRLERTG